MFWVLVVGGVWEWLVVTDVEDVWEWCIFCVGCALGCVGDGGVHGVFGFDITPRCCVFAAVGEESVFSEQVGSLEGDRCIVVPLALFCSHNGGVCLYILSLWCSLPNGCD